MTRITTIKGVRNTPRNIERARKTAQTRSDLTKPNGFKDRNYIREYENGKIVKELNEEGKWVVKEPEVRPRKLTKIQKKSIKEAKELEKQNSTNKLERSPEKDILDLSGEEQGYFKVGDVYHEIRFPR